MGWNVSLENHDGSTVQLTTGHTAGGTLLADAATMEPVPNDEAWMSVTFNYAHLFKMAGINLSTLHLRNAGESIMLLEATIDKLGTTKQSDNYWDETPGNAGFILQTMLDWAREVPEARWRIV